MSHPNEHPDAGRLKLPRTGEGETPFNAGGGTGARISSSGTLGANQSQFYATGVSHHTTRAAVGTNVEPDPATSTTEMAFAHYECFARVLVFS